MPRNTRQEAYLLSNIVKRPYIVQGQQVAGLFFIQSLSLIQRTKSNLGSSDQNNDANHVLSRFTSDN